VSDHFETLGFEPVLRLLESGQIDLFLVDQLLLHKISYNLNPLFLFFVEVFVPVSFLSDMEVHAHNSHEEVHTEDTPDHDEEHENVGHVSVVIRDRA
jgi:hypothetical protein